MRTPQRLALCEEMRRIARHAGHIIMRHYGRDVSAARLKRDASPVTAADALAERYILRELARLCPSIPAISEEAAEAGRLPLARRRFFLVDPLDGTREFLKKNGEFTVNIAYVENDRALCGVLYAPAKRRLFWGSLHGGAYEERGGGAGGASGGGGGGLRRLHPRKTASPVLALSRGAQPAYAESQKRRYKSKRILRSGSAIKFAMLACGEAQIYPRQTPSMAWDTAAGQALLEAAGGHVVDQNGEPLRYAPSRGWRNGSFLASVGAFRASSA